VDRVEKFFRKINPKLRRKIIEVIRRIKDSKLDGLDVRPLKGLKGAYRCRVGNVRILFIKGPSGSTIFEVGFRGDVYKR